MQDLPGIHIRMTVTLDCGHVLHYTGKIDEKYPFFCEECEYTPTGKYPWTIAAELVSVGGIPVGNLAGVIRIFYEAGYEAGRPCACGHERRSHWELAEPGGPRKGCGVLGCGCGAYAG